MRRMAWRSWAHWLVVFSLAGCVRVHASDPYSGGDGGGGAGAVSGGGVGGGGVGGVGGGVGGRGGIGGRGGAGVGGGVGGVAGTVLPTRSCAEQAEVTAGITSLSSACFACSCD